MNWKVRLDKSKNIRLKIFLKKNIITLILGILQIIFAGAIAVKIVGIEESFNEQISVCDNAIYAMQQISSNTENNHIENSVVNNYDSFINENMDKESLLTYAKNAFEAGDYDRVIQIYSMNKMAGEPIVLTNMAYMYANGIYFSFNIDKADYYYDLAIAQGFEMALSNKLALHLRYQDEVCLDILRQGYELNNNNIINFFALHYTAINIKDVEENKEYLRNYLENMNREEQWEELISERFYYWKDNGLEIWYYVPCSDEMTSYEYVRSGIEGNGNNSQMYRIYKRFNRICIGIALLDERFVG